MIWFSFLKFLFMWLLNIKGCNSPWNTKVYVLEVPELLIFNGHHNALNMLLLLLLLLLGRFSRVHMLRHVQLLESTWTVATGHRGSPGSSIHQIILAGILELPFPSPGDLRNPGIELTSPVSVALAGGFFTTALPVLNGV